VQLARLATDPEPTTRDGFIGVLNAGLPTKRVIAQGLIRNSDNEILLCELTYKREWDLPGGVVDPHESPAQAVAREIAEEMQVEVSPRSSGCGQLATGLARLGRRDAVRFRPRRR